jgi:hypothetical protein
MSVHDAQGMFAAPGIHCDQVINAGTIVRIAQHIAVARYRRLMTILFEEHPSQGFRLCRKSGGPKHCPLCKIKKNCAALGENAAVIEFYGRNLADGIDSAKAGKRCVAGVLSDLDAAVLDSEMREQQSRFVDITRRKEAIENDHWTQPFSESARTVPRRTLAPKFKCSDSVCSAGLWLMPPTLGTKIIAAGQIRAII